MKHPLVLIQLLSSLFLNYNLKAQLNSDRTIIADFENEPKVVWKFKAAQPFMSSPIINGQNVFISNLDSCLYALDLNSGKTNWKFKSNGPIRSNVCIENSHLYLLSGDGNLYCLNQADGKLEWTFKAKDKMYDVYDYYQS